VSPSFTETATTRPWTGGSTRAMRFGLIITLAGAMTSSVGNACSRTRSIRSCLNRGEPEGTTIRGTLSAPEDDEVVDAKAAPRASPRGSGLSDRLQPPATARPEATTTRAFRSRMTPSSSRAIPMSRVECTEPVLKIR
jgi:hypothetical protein